MPPAMLPRVARSTPRMLIARDSMPWSPIARAHLHRPLGERDRLAGPCGQHQVRREPGQDARPDRSTAASRRAGRRPPRERGSTSRYRRPARPRCRSRSRARARRSRSRVGVRGRCRVDELERVPCVVDRARGVADEGRRRARRVEQPEQVAIGRSVRRRRRGPTARSRARTGGSPRRRRRRRATRRRRRWPPRSARAGSWAAVQ